MADVLTNYALRKETGAGKRLARAVLALAEAGLNIEYITLQKPDISHNNITFNILTTPGLDSKKLPDHHSPWFWARYMIRASLECVKSARKDSTKVLMAFTFGGSIPLLLATMITGKPLIIFLRSDEAEELAIKETARPWRWLFGLFENTAVKKAARLVTVTNILKEILIKRHGPGTADKMSVLYNDIPEICISGKSDIISKLKHAGCFVYSTCSSLTPRKNIGLLLKAFADCRDKNNHLLIIGDGPELETLKKSADSLNIQSKVTFALWQDKAAELVAQTDLFVLPSLAEGMSNSLLEALAADVPCLVSDIAEHAELFPDKNLRFDPRNPKQLADMMTRAGSEPEFLSLLKSLTQGVKQKLSFNWDRELVSIIENTINEK